MKKLNVTAVVEYGGENVYHVLSTIMDKAESIRDISRDIDDRIATIQSLVVDGNYTKEQLVLRLNSIQNDAHSIRLKAVDIKNMIR